MANTTKATTLLDAGGEKQAVNCEGVPAGQLWVHGINGSPAFSGTAAIEVTLDGENWKASSVSPLAAGEYKVIPELALYVRINVTAYTSGSMQAAFGMYTPQ